MFGRINKLVLIYFFISINLMSQSISNYGLKIGASVSNPVWKIESHSVDGVETKLGYNLGAFMEWKLSKQISLLTEIHYIQKGLRFYMPAIEFYGPNNGYSVYVESISPSVSYLSFPVMVKYDLLQSEVVPYFIGGLRVDFVLSKASAEQMRWFYRDINDVDFGASFGLGFQTKSFFGIGTGLEIKYSPSFLQISSSMEGDIKNRSFEVVFLVYY